MPDNIDKQKDEESLTAKHSQNHYYPWNESYALSVYLCSIAIILIWIGTASQKLLNFGSPHALVISAVLFVISLFIFKQGTNREFGKSFEERCVKKAKIAFEGTGLKVIDWKMTRVGDIDLFVETNDKRIVNVEIKTWRSYGKHQKYQKREKRGLNQIHSQRGAIDADMSILWLPQSGQDWFKRLIFGEGKKIDDDIYLCCGRANGLKNLLLKLTK
jgi:hypothetical protein